MPQSFTCLHYHFVFSTKRRARLVSREMQPRLYEYLAGTIRGVGGIPIQIGGTDDHVHILVTLNQKHSVADFMRDLKAASSGWIHDTFPDAVGFGWQPGYGAFSVSHSSIDTVKTYIANQEEHHRTLSFQDEFRALLKKHGIEFDEKYLWD